MCVLMGGGGGGAGGYFYVVVLMLFFLIQSLTPNHFLAKRTEIGRTTF